MWLRLTGELDVQNEEKGDSEKIFFSLNKWVEDETIYWNQEDQKTGLTGQADGRWKRDVLSLRCQLDVEEYMVRFTQVLGSEEKLTPDYELRSHQKQTGDFDASSGAP